MNITLEAEAESPRNSYPGRKKIATQVLMSHLTQQYCWIMITKRSDCYMGKAETHS